MCRKWQKLLARQRGGNGKLKWKGIDTIPSSHFRPMARFWTVLASWTRHRPPPMIATQMGNRALTICCSWMARKSGKGRVDNSPTILPILHHPRHQMKCRNRWRCWRKRWGKPPNSRRPMREECSSNDRMVHRQVANDARQRGSQGSNKSGSKPGRTAASSWAPCCCHSCSKVRPFGENKKPHVSHSFWPNFPHSI